MNQHSYKRTYHPLIIVLYTSGMLSEQQIKEIPKTTRWNWDKFIAEQHFHYNWTEDYVKDLNNFTKIYQQKQLYSTIKFLLQLNKGYSQILNQITSSKKLLKDNAKSIVNSIDRVTSSSKIKTQTACKFYNVSKDWYHREKRKLNCSLNVFNICFKQHPSQLSLKESTTIENIVTNPENFGKTKTTLYYQALRSEILYCAKSTFCKYATALGYQKPIRLPKIQRKGLRAIRIFEWLHVDITYVPTLNDGMQKVAFVKDNFSKAILHYKTTSDKAGSNFIATLFQETFEKHNLFEITTPINILSDGGPENKGEFISWIRNINTPPIIRKLTARTPEFPQANNMAESTHSIYKTEFLKGKIVSSKLEHVQSIIRFVEYYNYKRFPTELFGYNPMEIINGEIPDKYRFTKQIAQARIDRIKENQDFNQCKLVKL
jgi:transposase InsO family protein